ncbi:cation:proton antiporter [Litchfieldella anticariensis FP35 = DSM 16096]|uniref:Cation:proton antiporter n=1 Tax=Litchfieldella anticariensis (strain DSM 16096 / CECT 5854 / CIP 108499 / LMG 22089 / FP35) TaxID=1121939 RepID=S2LDW3_LITA3|nr:Na+/H+ antiporter subunit E [Halomonas anticariensis]EPC02936.1 cation:proton antiporter [Halomonas anticariensis FP35 = DSM 16096]
MIGAIWNLLLALAWVVLTGDFSGHNLLAGLVFGYLTLALIQSHDEALSGYAQWLPRLILFIGFFLKELVKANLRVAFDIVTPPWYMKPGVIAMPLKAKTDLEITFFANLISLTPGTLSLDVSDDRRVLYIHAMFLDDEQELRRGLEELERRALELFRREESV